MDGKTTDGTMKNIGGKMFQKVLSIKRRKEMVETIEEMVEKVIEYLKDNKCVIVVDDLSSMSEWRNIEPMFRKSNGSRIIVTTRDMSLAKSISHDMHEIQPLSEYDAKDLFFRAVYKTSNYRHVKKNGDKKEDPPQHPSSSEINEVYAEVQNQCKMTDPITSDMETQAGLIIEKCGQLPIAIVAIGSFLATKPKTSAEWKAMYDHISSELANNSDLGVVKNVLSSSYDGLPYHLKSCLLYLGVFHNHNEIRKTRIIRRWMADGYVMGDRNKTSEEVGKGYFNDLMGRSLIQPSRMTMSVDGDVNKCNIHDVMYELILEKSMDENGVSLFDDQNLLTMTDKVRHLVMTGGQEKQNRVPEKLS